MGVSGNDMGTLGRQSSKAPLHGALAPLTTWMLSWSSRTASATPSTPTSHDSAGPESKLWPASLVEDQTDPV
jgi:hypothetical protein